MSQWCCTGGGRGHVTRPSWARQRELCGQPTQCSFEDPEVLDALDLAERLLRFDEVIEASQVELTMSNLPSIPFKVGPARTRTTRRTYRGDGTAVQHEPAVRVGGRHGRAPTSL